MSTEKQIFKVQSGEFMPVEVTEVNLCLLELKYFNFGGKSSSPNTRNGEGAYECRLRGRF